MARPKSSINPVVSVEFTYNPASVAAATAADISLTSSTDSAIGQLRTGYPVILWAPSLEAGLTISDARCDSAGTLKFRLANVTAAAVDPASQSFRLVQF
jgi:hypothetical protein